MATRPGCLHGFQIGCKMQMLFPKSSCHKPLLPLVSLNFTLPPASRKVCGWFVVDHFGHSAHNNVTTLSFIKTFIYEVSYFHGCMDARRIYAALSVYALDIVEIWAKKLLYTTKHSFLIYLNKSLVCLNETHQPSSSNGAAIS